MVSYHERAFQAAISMIDRDVKNAANMGLTSCDCTIGSSLLEELKQHFPELTFQNKMMSKTDPILITITW